MIMNLLSEFLLYHIVALYFFSGLGFFTADEGYTNRQIAGQLCISVKEVDRHRENVLNKLNLHNCVELVNIRFERG